MELVMQVMVFSMALMLLVMVFFGRHGMEAFRCIIAAGVPVTALFLVRTFVKSRPFTIAAHAAVFVFAFMFGGNGVEKASFCLVCSALIFYSMFLTINEKRRFDGRMPLGGIFLFIGALITGSVTEVLTVEQWALYFGIVFIIVQIIYHNLENMNHFMVMNREVSDFPAKQFVSVNMFIMTIVLTLCAGIMVISNNKYIYKMLDVLSGLLFRMARFFFGMLARGDVSEIPEAEEIPADRGLMEELNDLLSDWDTGLLEDILNGLAVIIMVIVLVGAVIGTAAALVRTLRRVKGAAGLEGDIKEFVEPEGVEIRRLRRKKSGEAAGGDPKNIKARKLYKAMAGKNALRQGKEISGNMMPEEISRKYIPAEADAVTEIYEKARYSRAEVSKEELELLKAVRKSKI